MAAHKTPKELLDWETQVNSIYKGSSGNCNFQYISGLLAYLNRPNVALVHILTLPCKGGDYNYGANVPYNGVEPRYAGTPYAMYLFAQGSEDPIDKRPYGPQLKDTIEANGLGQVLDCGPAPNLMHNKKPGILYVWKIDHDACYKWWKVNVHDQWKARNEREDAAAKQAAVREQADEHHLEANDQEAKAAQKIAAQEAKNAEAILTPLLNTPKPRRWRCKRVLREKAYHYCYHLNEATAKACASCGHAKPAPRKRNIYADFARDYWRV